MSGCSSLQQRRPVHVQVPSGVGCAGCLRRCGHVVGSATALATCVLRMEQADRQMRRSHARSVMQCWWRQCLAKQLLDILKKAEAKRIRCCNAATCIQRIFRGYIAYRCVILRKLEVVKALRIIIAAYRGFKNRLRRTSAIYIQCFVCCCHAKNLLAKKKARRALEHCSSITIQKFIRCMLAKRIHYTKWTEWKDAQEHNASNVIQRALRCYIARCKFQRKRQDVTMPMQVSFSLCVEDQMIQSP